MIGLFFDTETTGVKSWKDPSFIPRLVQLGAILQDLDTGRVLAEINMIARVDSQIPAAASAVHGITTEMANKYGFSVNDIDSCFVELVSMADILVAHNINYDLEVMKDNLPLSAIEAREVGVFCTMEASTDIVKTPFTEKQLLFFKDYPDKKDGEYKKPNLTETYKYFFNVTFEGAHDAMADIRACRDIFLQLIEREHFEAVGKEIKKKVKEIM